MFYTIDSITNIPMKRIAIIIVALAMTLAANAQQSYTLWYDHPAGGQPQAARQRGRRRI